MKKIVVGLSLFCFVLFGIEAHVNAGYFSLFNYADEDDFSVKGAALATDRHATSDQWSDEYKGWYDSNVYLGYYLGTFGRNDKEQTLEKLISTYLNLNQPYDIASLFKVEVNDKSNPRWTAGTDGPLTVTAGGDYTAGTWTLTGPTEIGFYALKGADEFALYYVHPYQSSGKWSTQHLQNGGGRQPELSHFSAAVPEPTSLLLLGFGLVGLAGARRILRK